MRQTCRAGAGGNPSRLPPLKRNTALLQQILGNDHNLIPGQRRAGDHMRPRHVIGKAIARRKTDPVAVLFKQKRPMGLEQEFHNIVRRKTSPCGRERPAMEADFDRAQPQPANAAMINMAVVRLVAEGTCTRVAARPAERTRPVAGPPGGGSPRCVKRCEILVHRLPPGAGLGPPQSIPFEPTGPVRTLVVRQSIRFFRTQATALLSRTIT